MRRRPTEALQSTPTPELEARVAELAGDASGEVDWERIAAALRERRGVPVAVTPAPTPSLGERIGGLGTPRRTQYRSGISKYVATISATNRALGASWACSTLSSVSSSVSR